MWDLPGPGIEHVSPALAGGFFSFLAVLGLRCCARAHAVPFIAVHMLLTVVASVVAEHGL